MNFKYQPIVSTDNALFCFEALYDSPIQKNKTKEFFFRNNKNNSNLHKSIIGNILRERDEKKELNNKMISINIPISFFTKRKNMNYLESIKNKNQIILELSEMDNEKNINSLCEEIKGKGFLLAIDDYGVKYSNDKRINELKEYLDIVKFDKSWFYKDVDVFLSAYEKLKNFICIIEGVESKIEYELSVEIGFKYYQGYYFSKPLVI